MLTKVQKGYCGMRKHVIDCVYGNVTDAQIKRGIVTDGNVSIGYQNRENVPEKRIGRKK